MVDENTPRDADAEADDAYVIEDRGDTVEDIEREMRETAQEAAVGAAGAGLNSESLAEENRVLKDRVLRTLADFENYKKRSDREKADFFKYALGR